MFKNLQMSKINSTFTSETKICSKCSIEKEISEFRVRGVKHINQCKVCEREFNSQWKQRNKVYTKIYNQSYKEKYFASKDNVIKAKTQQKKWRDINKAYIKQYTKETRKIYNIKRNQRKQIDLVYRLKCQFSTIISLAFRRSGYSKKSHTYDILGCPFQEFKQHLESLWEPWMNWENYGKYNGELNHGWDIDHIIPMASAKTQEDVIRLNHYTNLQPLCSKVNRDIKKNNY